MKKGFFLYIIYILTFINFSNEYIVIPFKKINSKQPQSYNFNDITGKDFLDFSKNILVSSISLGTPYKTLELYLTMDYKLFFIGKGYCLKDAKSFYEPIKSSSYSHDENLFYSHPFNDLRNMTVGNDICSLYNDYNLKSNISLNKIQLYYGNIVDFSENIFDKDKICGIMGLKYHYENSYYGKFKGLEYILKMNDISNSSFWSIEFFDDSQKSKNGNFDGYLILGAGDHKYLKDIKNISEDNIHFSYNTYTVGSLEWISHFQSVYYYKSKDEKVEMSYDFSNVGFNFDNRYYFSSKEYFESIKLNFFNEYLKKGICTIHELKEFYLRYKYITCNKKNFNEEKNKFPILYFFSSGFNYTFELTYNDLFIDINDHILFLMFFDPWNPKIFKFGEKFMTKYQLLFVIDQKNIGFINYSKKEEKKDKDEKQDFIKKKRKFEIIWVIVLLVLLVGIIIGILVGNKLWDNKRKKRANELTDDDYEYEGKKEPIN